MFLLISAHPGSPEERAIKQAVVVLLLLLRMKIAGRQERMTTETTNGHQRGTETTQTTGRRGNIVDIARRLPLMESWRNPLIEDMLRNRLPVEVESQRNLVTAGIARIRMELARMANDIRRVTEISTMTTVAVMKEETVIVSHVATTK